VVQPEIVLVVVAVIVEQFRLHAMVVVAMIMMAIVMMMVHDLHNTTRVTMLVAIVAIHLDNDIPVANAFVVAAIAVTAMIVVVVIVMAMSITVIVAAPAAAVATLKAVVTFDVSILGVGAIAAIDAVTVVSASAVTVVVAPMIWDRDKRDAFACGAVMSNSVGHKCLLSAVVRIVLLYRRGEVSVWSDNSIII